MRYTHLWKENRLIQVLAIVLILSSATQLWKKYFIDQNSSSNYVQCSNNLLQLGCLIGLYSEEHGRFPDGGWDHIQHCPRWIWQLEQYSRASLNHREFVRLLKCPADKTASITSYDFNPKLLGKKVTTSGTGKVILLTERGFKGNHHRSYYYQINLNRNDAGKQ